MVLLYKTFITRFWFKLVTFISIIQLCTNMKLDLYDKKLLYHLDINSRYTLGELSKKVRLSKKCH